jgi:metal-dependent hydrolase (beta-lactamase superfamily II)
MAEQDKGVQKTNELLRDILITLLASEGCSHSDIRSIVGASNERVSKINGAIRKGRKTTATE